MCQWLDAETFLSIQQPESRAENARRMLCDLREKGVILSLDGAREGYKIRSSGHEKLTAEDRTGMNLCREALRQALLREAERCIRCCGKNKMAWRQDLCHDCIQILGMPIYECMTADKRLLARMEGAKRDQAMLPKDRKEAMKRLQMIDGGLL